MAGGRHHSVPLPPAAGSAKVKFTLTSLSAASSSSVFRRERAGGDGRGGAGREKDHGDGGERGGGGGGRPYGPSERERERSRTDGSSTKDTVRDSSSNNSSRDHGARDVGRDGIASDGGKDVGRDSGRDSGKELGRETARESGKCAARDIGRDHRLRNLARDEIARGSGSEGGGERGYGKEKDRSDRIRDWEQAERGREREREKSGRERERDRKERDLSGVRHQHQQQHQRRYSGCESGEKDRAASPLLYGRPPLSAVSGPAVLSTARNPPFPAGDFGSDREASGPGEARSSGARLKEKDAEREPGELPSGRRVEEISWRSDPSHSMSLHSRNARRAQPLEPDDDTKRSPPKKRKFSPIVWDYDEKHPRPSTMSSVSGAPSWSPAAKLGSGAAPPPSQQLPVQPSRDVQSGPSFPLSSGTISPPSEPPSTGQGSPSSSRGTHEAQGTPPSPQESTLSPLVERIPSPFVKERSNETDAMNFQMECHVMGSPMSDDEPETGQLLPEPDERTMENSRMESPVEVEEDEDEENAPPSITIARSRWAGETNTPGREKFPRAGGGGNTKKRSSSLESEKGRASSRQDGGQLTSGPSTSPEPGEYIQGKLETASWGNEKSNESDGSVAHGGGGKDRRSNSIEDEEYDRELNQRELMELEEDDSDEDDEEEQRPYVESEFEGGPVNLSGPQSRAIDMLQGCRSVDEFERLNKIDEGTYGVVYRARNKKTGEIVALKKVKMEKEKEGFPMTSLREINVLLSFHHPSVVDVKEVVVGSCIDSIYMVMEYMEHDLKGLMETMKQPFSQSEVKCLMLQLLEGVKYLHDNWVLHRDLKTSNLLLNNRGELKICDFGLARQYGSPLKAYTHMVVTLWYRAPELLLGSRTYQYSTAIDMWSLGCIMAEFLAKEPLFNGKSEIDQLDKIFKTLGTPNEKIWPEFMTLPGVKCNFVRQPYNRLRERFPPTAFAGRPTLSEKGFDLLNRLLTYDPRKRITADEALKHEWFREVPLPKSKEFMPTFPARSEHDRRVRRLMKSPDPLEEQRKRELHQGEFGGGGLFG